MIKETFFFFCNQIRIDRTSLLQVTIKDIIFIATLSSDPSDHPNEPMAFDRNK